MSCAYVQVASWQDACMMYACDPFTSSAFSRSGWQNSEVLPLLPMLQIQNACSQTSHKHCGRCQMFYKLIHPHPSGCIAGNGLRQLMFGGVGFCMLRSLDLTQNRLNDSCLAVLAGLPHLHHLSLAHNPVQWAASPVSPRQPVPFVALQVQLLASLGSARSSVWQVQDADSLA